jgi:hypothetical protein
MKATISTATTTMPHKFFGNGRPLSETGRKRPQLRNGR